MKNANIGKKITMVFGVVLVISSLTTGVGLWEVSKMRAATKDILDGSLAKERLVSDWYRLIYAGTRRTLAIAKNKDNTLLDFFAADSAKSSKESGETLKKVGVMLTSEKEGIILKDLSDARDGYNKYKAIVTKAKAAKDDATVNSVFDAKLVPACELYEQRLRELVDYERKQIDIGASDIEAAAMTSFQLQSALTAFLILLVIVCGFALKSSIVGPLRYAISVARKVAKGDLTADVTVNSRDEAGELLQALGDMNLSLRSLISEVMQSADTITNASGEIAQGNADLSRRTESQAAGIEETAGSMEELTATVSHNADNAGLANKLALGASMLATKGGDVVSQAVATMAEIKLGSQRISEITSIIDGIAFQTNILALNAAVEAARAGEQGRGFAVVASEVRNLAQRSAAVANEISLLIGASVDKVNTGSKLVDNAGATMNDIVKSIKEVAQIMSEISAATREQNTGLTSVNQIIAEMDNSTRMNAAMVEQASAAAMSMQDEATRLSTAISVFRITESHARRTGRELALR